MNTGAPSPRFNVQPLQAESMPPTGRRSHFHDASLDDSSQEKTYNNPADRFWTLYLADADKNDAGMTESIKGDTDGILIFTGLFAATVAAFIVEFYKTLNPDPGDETVTLLSSISSQVSTFSNRTQAPPSGPPFFESFHVPAPSIRINSLWFISLFLSLYVALASTLIQQWCRRYLRAARRRGPPHKRGPVHAVVAEGMERFHVQDVAEVIIALLHLSVFLFLGGLLDFLFVVNASVAYALLPFLAAGATTYSFLTILPFFFPSTPYDTPLTHIVRVLVTCVHISLGIVWWSIQNIRRFLPPEISVVFSTEHLSPPVYHRQGVLYRPKVLVSRLFCTRNRVLEEVASTPSQERTQYALHNSLKVLDEEWEIEEFITGLPGFLGSTFVRGHAPETALYLIRHHYLLFRMKELIYTCHPQHNPSQLPIARRSRRVQVVLYALQNLLALAMESPTVLCTLRDMDAELQASASFYAIVKRAYFISRSSGTDLSFAVSAACALAQLRDEMVNGIVNSAGAGAEIGSAPNGDSYVLRIFRTSWSAARPGGPFFDPADIDLRWTPSSAKTAPISSNESASYVMDAIRRGGYLHNLNIFLQTVWGIDRRSDGIPTKDHDLVMQTMTILSHSFEEGCAYKGRIMWQDAVDKFAELWEEIMGDRCIYALPAQFLELLRHVANFVLPLATPFYALRAPLPDPTPSEIVYLEGSPNVAEGGDVGSRAPTRGGEYNDDYDAHTIEPDPARGTDRKTIVRFSSPTSENGQTLQTRPMLSPELERLSASAGSREGDGRAQAPDADGYMSRSLSGSARAVHKGLNGGSLPVSYVAGEGDHPLNEEDGTRCGHEGGKVEVVVVSRDGADLGASASLNPKQERAMCM